MLRTLALNSARAEDDGPVQSAEDVAITLRDYLVSFPLKGGERIFEANIARELEVSRPLVREACRVLEGEGLLVYTANKGYSLRTFTGDEVVHLMEFRLLLEEAAFTTAASMPSRTDVVNKMYHACQGIESSSVAEDPARQISADLTFHRVVIENMGNPWVLHSFDRMSTQFRYAIRLMGRSLHDFKIYAPSHDVLITCVAEGNVEEARKEIRRHIRMFIPSLVKRISR